jgi:catechol 2,3-dioxygenase-like lactoylglutathione lyase family enzyme
MLHREIDSKVDPFGISNRGRRAGFQVCSQDLASATKRDLYDDANGTVSGDDQMQLGNFSVGLAVKDIAASRAFYEKLGFTRVAGDEAQHWLILQNSTSTIGLFQGPQFTRNMLTFNPGWDRTGSPLPDFDDVRDIQRTLQSRGVVPTASADESSTGPASIVLTDPDGNPILIDQHVPRPQN